MEIIIAVTVLGILATLAAVGVNNAKQKTRDNRRLEDMRLLRSAMQLVYNETGSYNENICEPGMRVADCRGEELLRVVDNIQRLRDPNSNGVPCTQDFSEGCDYAFQSINSDGYSVFFYLEEGTQGYAKGQHVLTEQGIQ